MSEYQWYSVWRKTNVSKVRRLASSCVLVVLCICCVEVRAIWQPMTLEELVDKSDLIVLGDVTEVRPQSDSPSDIATIRIQEVIYSKVKQNESLRQVSLTVPSKRGAIPSDALFYKAGQRGVWFLRRVGPVESTYAADHPQRLQQEQEVGKVRALLKSRGHR
jgi:hypothetical protein